MNAVHEMRLYPTELRAWSALYRDMSFLPHWHEEIELILVREGSVDIRVGGSAFTARKNDLIICEGSIVHSGDFRGEANALEFIVFNPGLVHTAARPPRPRCSHIPRDRQAATGLLPETLRLFREVPQELAGQASGYSEIVKGLLRAYWYRVLRLFPAEDAAEPADSAPNPAEARIQELLYELERRYRDNISLGEAARRVNFSESYFSRCFKQYTGTGFAAYRNILRVEYALQRLQASDEAIARIALDCGFNDLRTFNRVFRQFTGCSPTDVRRSDSAGTCSITFQRRKTQRRQLVENDSPVVIARR